MNSELQHRSGRRLASPSAFLLPVLAGVIFFAGRAPFLGQWDSFDYLKQIFSHRLSDLGFGRPVFIGYNIVIWEALEKSFGLAPTALAPIVMSGIILAAVLGVIVFRRLALRLFSSSESEMAALGLMLSPLYAIYAGYIMTEIPMLLSLMTGVLLLWDSRPQRQILRAVSAGLFFGLAVGIREQALTLVPAFLWILWIRRPEKAERVRSIFYFSAAALLSAAGPVAVFYFSDPAGFAVKMRIWLQAIPMQEVHFWKNVQASLLYAFILCPAAWLAALIALIWNGRHSDNSAARPRQTFLHGLVGTLCCLGLPLMALWRDADVQIHPRYILILLPAAIILCTYGYSRWARFKNAALWWGILHVATFGLSWTVIQPFRDVQTAKMGFAETVRDAVPGQGLLIGGSYSPTFDYCRAIRDRPGWQVLWSGWEWDTRKVDDALRRAWAEGRPVYFCDGPAGWLYFEDELLEMYFLTKPCPRRAIAPGIWEILPSRPQPGRRSQPNGSLRDASRRPG